MTNRHARLLSASVVVLAGGLVYASGVLGYALGKSYRVPNTAQIIGGWMIGIGGLMLVVDWVGSMLADGRNVQRGADPRRGFPVLPAGEQSPDRGIR